LQAAPDTRRSTDRSIVATAREFQGDAWQPRAKGKGEAVKLVRMFAQGLLLLVIVASSHARGEDFDGTTTQLARFAAVYERALASGVALAEDQQKIGYFEGFVIGVYFSHAWPCMVNRTSTFAQAFGIVAKYLRENPERWDRQSGRAVQEALEHGFGCLAK